MFRYVTITLNNGCALVFGLGTSKCRMSVTTRLARSGAFIPLEADFGIQRSGTAHFGLVDGRNRCVRNWCVEIIRRFYLGIFASASTLLSDIDIYLSLSFRILPSDLLLAATIQTVWLQGGPFAERIPISLFVSLAICVTVLTCLFPLSLEFCRICSKNQSPSPFVVVHLLGSESKHTVSFRCIPIASETCSGDERQ